jgi:hypothetical protein
LKRLLVLALLLCAGPAHGLHVRWEGTAPNDADAIRRALSAGADAIDAAVAARAAQLLAERGHFWPDVSPHGDTLVIDAGPAGMPGLVHTTQAPPVPSVAVETFRAELRGRTDRRSIEAALETFVNDLVGRGFPYAQVRLRGIDITRPPRVDFSLAILAGPRVHAGALRTDAERTHAVVFEREAAWRRGVPLDLAVIERSQEGVGTLPFVLDLDTARLIAVTGDTADLYLPLREAASVQAGGMLGWVPTSDGGFWGGELDLELLSPFGRGRSIRLHITRRDPDSRRTEFTFLEPWPWGLPFWVGGTLRQDDFAMDFIETEVTGRVRLATAAPHWEVDGTWSKVSTEEEPAPETFPARRYGLALAVSDSSLDRGYRFALRWSRQRLLDRADAVPEQAVIEHTQGMFGAFRWATLARSVHMHYRVDGAGTLAGPATVASNLLHRVGGVHSLRGYREAEFLVRDYLRLALELHLGSRRQSLLLFGDVAWLSFTAQPDAAVAAAGAGLRVGRRFQVLIGVPSRGGLEATKVHVAVSTAR